MRQMSDPFAAETPTVEQARKREEPARERERGFARRIDCTPGAVRAPLVGRAGRGAARRPGEQPGDDEGRAARR